MDRVFKSVYVAGIKCRSMIHFLIVLDRVYSTLISIKSVFPKTNRIGVLDLRILG